MKKTLILTLLAAALLLAACGGQPAPAQPPAAEAAASSSESHSDEDMTEMDPTALVPTAVPTPAGSDATSANDKIQVKVTMGDNWIMSDITTFKVGQTYVFNITNTGNRVHNFNINKPAAELTTSAIQAAYDGALLRVPNAQLGPGASVSVEFTFTQPAAPGELEFSCLIERHYKSGQVLPIIVEP
ncbi:MAG: hypothetical protein WHV44_07965 [Anaerolineales bacterium]